MKLPRVWVKLNTDFAKVAMSETRGYTMYVPLTEVEELLAKEREETESFPGQSKLNLIDELWAAAADEHYCRTIRNFLDKFRKDNLLSSRESAPGEEP